MGSVFLISFTGLSHVKLLYFIFLFVCLLFCLFLEIYAFCLFILPTSPVFFFIPCKYYMLSNDMLSEIYAVH
jgi:hypothetical protein